MDYSRTLAVIRRLRRWPLVAALVVIATTIVPIPAVASTAPAPVTIPYFKDSFTTGGVTYTFRMVGSNPRTTGDRITLVPVIIVPIRFRFADGHVAELGDSVAQVITSPLFIPAQFSSGFTQYGDAIRRAMFWKYTANTDYHVFLYVPKVVSVQTLDVPAGQGVFLKTGDPVGPGFHVATPTGIFSDAWFGYGDGPGAFRTLLDKLNLDTKALVMAVSRNAAIMTPPLPGGLPLFGFHSAFTSTTLGKTQVQTLIWAAYSDPYAVQEVPNITHNVDILSHEVSEWLHDPFLDDVTPNWISPLPIGQAFYGCSNLLETGDPVVDSVFTVRGYQLQDEAFLSWFAHQSPSIGIGGQYTYLKGTLPPQAPSC